VTRLDLRGCPVGPPGQRLVVSEKLGAQTGAIGEGAPSLEGDVTTGDDVDPLDCDGPLVPLGCPGRRRFIGRRLVGVDERTAGGERERE
jgi:hypothetical protein